MKKLKVAGLAVAVGVAVVMVMIVSGAGADVNTGAGTVLTNIVTASWTGGTYQATNRVTVGTNYGATWIGEDDKTVTAGSSTSNITYLTNDGNLSVPFTLTNAITSEAAAQSWTVYFTNLTAGGASGATLTTPNISPGGFNQIVFVVNVPSTETNGSYREYRCVAYNSDAISANATNYTGFNGTNYGGNMGKNGAAPGHVWLYNATTGTEWKVTVQAAYLQLAKSAVISNPAPYSGLTSAPVPGGIVTFKITYTNAGSATAQSVEIYDPILTQYVDYVSNSLKEGTFGSTYAAANARTDAANDDSCASINNTNFFYPNGTATSSAGNVAAAGNGAFFYRVYVR